MKRILILALVFISIGHKSEAQRDRLDSLLKYWMDLPHISTPPSSPSALSRELKLAGMNYAVTFSQEFLGKVIRGENVLRSFTHSLYEAIPPTALQYGGMKMVGRNWRLALPAQIIVQKGAELQRRSILGEPIISRELWRTWEVDYLWLNLRVSDGRVLPPRVNVGTVASSLGLGASGMRFRPKESLLTGSVIFSGNVKEYYGEELYNCIYVNEYYYWENSQTYSFSKWWDEGMSHEFIHVMQRVRGNPLSDVILHQDASQKRFLGFLRFDVAPGGAYLYDLFQKPIWGPQSHESRIPEWEAAKYSGTF